MRILVLVLTGLTIVFFIWQLLGTKGTWGHIIRAILILVFSFVIVVVNTVYISLTRGITWDAYFVAHTILGVLYFGWLVNTNMFGISLLHKKRRPIEHRISAYITGIFLLLALLIAGLMPFVR